MKELPNISVIIPCRNEEKYIADCLDSILESSYPKEKMEILVIDGASTDRTKEIITEYHNKYSYIKLLDNPKKITPCALNIGIQASLGEIIVRMDAHAKYAKDYIEICVTRLAEYNADNVGGIIMPIVKDETWFGKAITFVYSHPFGVGYSFFRIGSEKPRLVDTVFGGCYRKEIFKKIGLFNEQLARSQDMELNLRLVRGGGKIYLFPDIVNYYYAKSSLKDFFIHNFTDGIWAVYPLKFVKMPLQLRHYIPLLFVLGFFGLLIFSFLFPIILPIFIVCVSVYLALLLLFSAYAGYLKKDIKLLFLTPTAFIARHFGYGLGSIVGIIKLLW